MPLLIKEPAHALGTHLPGEVLNQIIQLVLEADRTAIVLPRQFSKVGVVHDRWSELADEEIVTSSCPLMRATKASRELYWPMFRQKFLDRDVDRIICKILDFNTYPFINSLWTPMYVLFGEPAAKGPYHVQLSFTDDFLHHSDELPEHPLPDSHFEAKLQQYFNMSFTVKPIPIQYVDKLQVMMNKVCYRAKEDFLHAQFQHVLGIIRGMFETREIVREEDRDKNMIGHWIEGKFVIKEAHEWKGDELDDEAEPMVWFD